MFEELIARMLEARGYAKSEQLPSARLNDDGAGPARTRALFGFVRNGGANVYTEQWRLTG